MQRGLGLFANVAWRLQGQAGSPDFPLPIRPYTVPSMTGPAGKITMIQVVEVGPLPIFPSLRGDRRQREPRTRPSRPASAVGGIEGLRKDPRWIERDL
jgi:hypothetical protein